MIRLGGLFENCRFFRKFSSITYYTTDVAQASDRVNDVIFRTNEVNPVGTQILHCCYFDEKNAVTNVRYLNGSYCTYVLILQSNHGLEHSGRFYEIPNSLQKQLFAYGGLPKQFAILTQSLNELCIMVRKPSIELVGYLKKTNFDAPVPRFVICK